ncbi:FAD-dependent oxidoreductase [Prochlorococcus marinus]|uniref:FAD-dependent oxidoreductase n=1 Tax=Prochlorococcus marinus TaxID=1219 RepID=UPI00094D855E|nr:FAD-dependent oxidoreductase [Prochlorococcus marinus]
MKNEIYDICIIGAGLAGLYTLNKLSGSGLKVICIEIGGNVHKNDSQFKLEFEQIGIDEYKGSKEGRSFGMGGTSYLWGGSLLPFTRYDFDKKDEFKNGYDLIRNVFDGFDHISLLKNLLGKEPKKEIISTWFKNVFNKDGYYEVSNVFIPFERKDFSSKKIQKDFKILTSHKLDHFKISHINNMEEFSIKEAVCLDLVNNEYISIEAAKFFLCAGALESSFIISKLMHENKNNLKKT